MLLIPIHNQFNVVDIPKVASTSLKKLALDYHGVASDKTNVHAKYIGAGLKPNKGPIYLVWRDPIQRWVSFYCQKILGTGDKPLIHKLSWVQERWAKLQTVDEAIECSLKSKERHFAPLTDFFNPKKIEKIIFLEELSSFLEKRGLPPIKMNTTRKPLVLTNEQKERLMPLYSKDYEYVKKYRR